MPSRLRIELTPGIRRPVGREAPPMFLLRRFRPASAVGAAGRVARMMMVGIARDQFPADGAASGAAHCPEVSAAGPRARHRRGRGRPPPWIADSGPSASWAHRAGHGGDGAARRALRSIDCILSRRRLPSPKGSGLVVRGFDDRDSTDGVRPTACATTEWPVENRVMLRR